MRTHHTAPPVGDLERSWRDALDRVQGFVAARVGDRELAADITQDVIVRSIASGALERVDNPAAWLYRAARNAVIDHYRTRRTHDPLRDPDAWPDPDQPADEPNAATRELSACLRPLLDQLAPPARDALVRVDVEGRTQRRAAAELGISVSGMKSRVQRARRELKQLLERCCTVELDRDGAITDYRRTTGRCGCTASEASPVGTDAAVAAHAPKVRATASTASAVAPATTSATGPSRAGRRHAATPITASPTTSSTAQYHRPVVASSVVHP
jgi:RNA polymerase sigma-70 factor (ECF subfamily)